MAEQNPISNPTKEPLEDRKMGGYGFFGMHDSSQIEVSKETNSAPTIFPGSGSNPANGSIKRV
jgi:anti-sigma regulatory factor (Ser/Thr protein kinase)